MGKKISEQLAEEMLAAEIEVSDKKIDKAQYDKSYSAVILGINQDFTDDVTAKEQETLINKYSIKEVPDKDNYYTFKINGNYYVKSSNTHFKLYEKVIIRVPNGSWDNMYIEVQRDTVSETTEDGGTKWFTSITQPTEGMTEGDYWARIDDEELKNIIGVKKYKDGYWYEDFYSCYGRIPTNEKSNIIFNQGDNYNIHNYLKDGAYNAIFGYNNAIARNLIEIDDDYVTLTNSTLSLNIPYSFFKNNNIYPQATEKEGFIVIFKVNDRFSDYKDNTMNKIRDNTDEEQNTEFSLVGCNYLLYKIYPFKYAIKNTSPFEIVYPDTFDDSSNYKCMMFIPVGTYGSKNNELLISGLYNIAYNKERQFVSPIENDYISENRANFCAGRNMEIEASENTIVCGMANSLKGTANSAVSGNNNFVWSRNSLISGKNNTLFSDNSIIGGTNNYICNLKNNSLICGEGLICNAESSGIPRDLPIILLGQYNLVDSSIGSTGSSIVTVGIGTSETRKNGLTLDWYGHLHIAGEYRTSGADYAEYYEWEDKNVDNEDRRGLFVTIIGRKISLANKNNNYILGVVSATPAVVGNSAQDEWHNRFKKDIFGAHIRDDKGNMLLSDEYNPNDIYIPRSQRPEYSPIGTHGQLIVIDDGTCEVNGYCGVGENGIGTRCDDTEKVYRGLAFRVTERLDETHVRIIIK